MAYQLHGSRDTWTRRLPRGREAATTGARHSKHDAPDDSDRKRTREAGPLQTQPQDITFLDASGEGAPEAKLPQASTPTDTHTPDNSTAAQQATPGKDPARPTGNQPGRHATTTTSHVAPVDGSRHRQDLTIEASSEAASKQADTHTHTHMDQTRYDPFRRHPCPLDHLVLQLGLQEA